MNTKLHRRRYALEQEGMTLVEIMVVMAIIALIAGGAAFVLFPRITTAKVNQTKADVQKISSAGVMWLFENSGCPTVETLVEEKILTKKVSGKDVWGTEFRIECTDDGVEVTSAGPDTEFGTEDDIQ